MSRQMVPFRILRMPCCEHQLCWVNPRLPSHCPECGEPVFIRLKVEPSLILYSDPEAVLISNP